MKKNNKNLLIFGILCIICLGLFFSVSACLADSSFYVFEAGIPGVGAAGEPMLFNGLNDFLTRLIIFVYRISFIIAFFLLLYTGFLYIFAGGNSSAVKKAMESLKFLGIGIGLMLFSYVILYTINPQLVKMNLFDLNMSPDDVVAILPGSLNNMEVKNMKVSKVISSDRINLIKNINKLVSRGDIGGRAYRGVLLDLKNPDIPIKDGIKTTLANVLT